MSQSLLSATVVISALRLKKIVYTEMEAALRDCLNELAQYFGTYHMIEQFRLR